MRFYFLFLILAFNFSARAEEALLIRSAYVIDGTGRPARGPVDIEIVGQKITRIGKDLIHYGAKIIVAKGKTVTPGLIDCHVHLRTVPGAIYRNDTLSRIHEQQRIQLQTYLAAGVTTVLDAATPLPFFKEVEDISKRVAIPRFKALSPFLTPRGGYFSDVMSRRSMYDDLSAPIEQASDIHDQISAALQFKPLGVKTNMEFGFSPVASLKTFDSNQRITIREEAEKAGLPVFVHAEEEKSFKLALEMKPYAFMHGGFFKEVPSDEIVEDIYNSKAFVVSTLAIYKMMLLMWEQDIFRDYWFQKLVPANQIETAKSQTNEVVRLLGLQNRPSFVPVFLAEILAPYFLNRNSVHKNDESSKAALKKMYDRHIPIVMGSDSGNYPLFTTFFHGVGSIFEIESLYDAGLPMIEVICSATSQAARMLKIDKEVGTIRVGQIADLLILNEDPIQNSHAFRKLAYVIKGGVAKRPEEWLK